jgi:ATP-dependent Clp protease protease subunit
MNAPSNDWIDSLLLYGVDKKNRRIFLFDDIDNMPIGLVIKALYVMEQESPSKPIQLFVGSYGGCEYDMFALYDTIQTIKTPVHTIAIGKCMSAAPLLVCCGKKGHRYASPNTFFMVHAAHGNMMNRKIDEVRNDLEHWKELDIRWNNLMEKHSLMEASFWKNQCEKGDRYFNATQAKEWGIIDHVWRPAKGK